VTRAASPCAPSSWPAGLLATVRHLTLLQIDPTAAIAPNADLVAWSRLGSPYQPAELDKALADRALLELRGGDRLLIAQVVSRIRHNSLDYDVQMFFALGNAMLDAGIAAWAAKYKWDFVRPTTAIRERYKGKTVTSWLGPYKGYGPVDGSQWIPYQAPNVVTPPFPEYVSGHSTFSSAAATILNNAGGAATPPRPSWSGARTRTRCRCCRGRP